MEKKAPTAKPPARYVAELQSMLYTFGDARLPLPETTSLLEDLVHLELRQLIRKTAQIANNRNHRSAHLTPEDFCFTLRGDEALMKRLRDFLAWRDLRRNVKGNSGNEAPGSAELVENGEEKVGKRPMRFPWDFSAVAVDLIPREVLQAYEDLPVSPLTRTLDSLDQSSEHSAIHAASPASRTDFFDTVTRSMSPSAYLEYSECRQASFTFKKLKKFREWLQPTQVTDYRLGDDCLELLGFVAWEFVHVVATCALDLQARGKLGGLQRQVRQQQQHTAPLGPFRKEPSANAREGNAQAPLLPSYLNRAYRQFVHKRNSHLYYQRFFLPE